MLFHYLLASLFDDKFVSEWCLWQTPSWDRTEKQFSLVPRTFLSLMKSCSNGIISKVLLSTVVSVYLLYYPHTAIYTTVKWI